MKTWQNDDVTDTSPLFARVTQGIHASVLRGLHAHA